MDLILNNLPLVNVFKNPYELWDERDQTVDEMIQSGNFHYRVKVKLNSLVTNHLEAAAHMLSNVVDNQLEQFIKNDLNRSLSYKKMREGMPSQTPKSISDYQNRFQSGGFHNVSSDINNIGKKLSEGQRLFHGGLWPIDLGEKFTTSRPFSTSFCAQIALRNAKWGGKAYDAGEINLFVLRVVTPQTNVFCCRINGTNKGHEAEVLFASGAELTLRSKTLIRSDSKVFKSDGNIAGGVVDKEVPAYVIEVDIS